MNKKLRKKWFLLIKAIVKKVFVLLIFGTCLVSVTEGYQQEVAIVQKPAFVKLDAEKLSVNQMINIVENQTNYRFSFDKNYIDRETTFTAGSGKQKLEKLLAKMIAQTGLSYRILNSSIHLRKKQAAEKDQQFILQETVSGQVMDAESGETLPGVNVMVKGTTTGASTDGEGRFELTVESLQDTLVLSFVGYQTREVPISGRTKIEVILQPQAIAGEELVVVGYGTAARKNVTGSIGSIDIAEQTKTRTFDNVGQFLQGHVPGLHADIATEEDGGTGLEIRGQNSINATNSPLIVIDGMTYYGNLSDINPNDVASIDVLKGASAAAVYGASAAAGVIEITTKQGTTPKPSISFKSSVGIGTPGDRGAPPFGPEGYVQYRRDMADRSDPSAPEYYYTDPRDLPSDITLEEWQALGTGSGEPLEIWLNRMGFASNESQNYIEGNSVDWQDEAFREVALRQNYNLSVSGKPEDLAYYLSLGYIDNKGELVGGRFRTVRARLNLSSTVADWLKVDLKSQYANRDQGFLEANASRALQVSPLGDIYDEDGSLKWYPHNDSGTRNPFLWTSQSGREYEWNSSNLIANLDAELLNLPFGLGYKVRWTNRVYFRREHLFDPSTVPWGEPAGVADRDEYDLYRWQVDNILTWDRTFADIHDFDATFLFNVEVENTWNTSASSSQFPLEMLGYSDLPLGTNPTVGSDDTRTTGTALMGRLNYRLLDRYLLTLSYRRDGYSAFGQSNPYSYFPSVALAWRLSEEPFLQVDPISNLKLRLSWGNNGNRSIGTYSALQRLGTSKYIYDKETVTNITISNLPNRGLKWERTEQYNVGLDFGLFNERILGTVDAYYMSTTDLLLERSLPEVTGYSSIWANLGEVVNRGLEVSFSSTNIEGNTFNWVSTLNFSLNRNEIKHLYGTIIPVTDDQGNVIGEREADDRENGWFIGHALDQIYDYEILGVWQEDEAEEAARYNKEPGDFKLRDVNGDGVLSPVEDKVFQGYKDPRYRLSLENHFNWRNLDVSFILTSWLGHYAAHNVHKHSGWEYGRLNQRAHSYWTPENPTNEWARLGSEGDNPNFNYWENTSFLKLQNFSIGYQIPTSVVNRINVKHLRLFVNARNVYALTGFDGADPETHYGTTRLFTLGVDLSF